MMKEEIRIKDNFAKYRLDNVSERVENVIDNGTRFFICPAIFTITLSDKWDHYSF